MISAWSVWARAMPIDTAVAATTSETASASVANSSTPRRRLDIFRPASGDAKPMHPFNSLLWSAYTAVVTFLPSRISRLVAATVAADLGEAVEE